MIPFDLSTEFGHTWCIDLDGTILKHNGYFDGKDELLPGVKELWNTFAENDAIVITTAREERFREVTIQLLNELGLRYDHIIFNLPRGERIVVNDTKPEGLKTAIAWNIKRDKGFPQ